MDQGFTIKQWKETQIKRDHTSYDTLKIEFETKYFKILYPILFATIKDNGNLIIINEMI